MTPEYDPDKHHRHSIRLRDWDYRTAGAYFITIVARGRECLFGDVVDGLMNLNAYGRIVHEEWMRSTDIRSEIALDAFVVMPNHIHAIVIIRNVGAYGRTPPVAHGAGAHSRVPLRPPRSLGSFIAGFKSVATKRINETRGTPGIPVWQRNFYERVIRNDRELNAIRQYITDNPANWEQDTENPARAPGSIVE